MSNQSFIQILVRITRILALL